MPLPTTAVTNEMLTAARGHGARRATTSRSCSRCSPSMSGVPRWRSLHERAASPAAEIGAELALDDVPSRWSRSACSRSRSNELYRGALMPGLAHLYIGEEAVAVGVCEALRRDDYITSTHRGHGHCLAKGASPDRMFAELLGKEAGYCKGKGGSMHIADPRHRQPRRERDRRRQRRHRDRRGVLGASARTGPGRGLLLRRRRARPGPALRGDEHRVALEAAGRSSSARTTSTTSTRTSRRRPPATSSARAAAFGIAARDGRRPGRARGLRRGRRSSSSARAQRRGPGVPAVQHLPLSRPPRRRHRPRLLPPEGRKSRSGSPSAIRHAARRVADGATASPTARRSTRSRTRLRRGDGRRGRVRAQRAVSRPERGDRGCLRLRQPTHACAS